MAGKNSWYVRVTKENQEACSKWRGFNVEIGKVVGISIDGSRGHNPEPYDYMDSDKYYFKNEITIEEFYQKIGLIKENKELEIEIW